MARVQLKQLRKQFDSPEAVVKDIDLTIQDGEFLVLVGPSGCGKTTTLRLIAGLEIPTSGEIIIDGKTVNRIAPKDRDISMVFQNYALYPHMSVYDNIAFGLKLRKYNRDEIRRRVREAAIMLEIEPLLDRKPKQLSGGQRQRVALGRAIVRKPKVFLFDEPLSNLDAKLRVQMRTEIKKLHQRLKSTMIYVTHDQVEAMTMGDRIAVMKAGIIHQIDTPLNLYEQPADLFVAGFIGSPSMNFVDVIIRQNRKLYAEGDHVRFDIPHRHTRSLRSFLDKKVVVGIRPEDLYFEQPTADRVPVPLTLDVVEPMGDETLLYLTSGSNLIIAKSTHLKSIPDCQQRYKIYWDLNRLHFFDPTSERVILPQ